MLRRPLCYTLFPYTTLFRSNLDEDSKAYLEGAYYGLGFYNSKKGNKAAADEYFQKVLKVNPNNENAKKALGM